ncbi:hypothetical protein ILUMI_08486 [Ignelater luminosus]|uniref:Oxidoreductase-like domain-containing protein n=1 Tax=Ignelater luminosus TaxID=2038154 RepID=A0A8K0D618_IGNLU|nr:hypothetical protein ILUMI_08486 [Ignelater luminosus]
MIAALRSRKIRQIIPNSNLYFTRYYADENKEIKDSKAVASQILQNGRPQLSAGDDKLLTKTPRAIAEQIISDYPEEPTTCCMSGCANCVWLEYAEKISAYYRDGGEQAVKEINERVSDPNIRAFLLQELRTMKKS